MSHSCAHRKFIVFDLDNTLANLGQQHVQGFRAALKTIYGIGFDEGYDGPGQSGNPLPIQLRSVCRARGISEEVIEAGISEAVKLMSGVTIAAMPNNLRGSLLPGVMELLDALHLAGHVLGLVTGTVGPTAHAALDRMGIQHYFTACAFGDEAEERVELLTLVLKRVTQIRGWRPQPSELVVIGDSPRDIHAAKAVGARAVGVATGFHTAAQLLEHGADVALPNLALTQVALDAILGEYLAGTSP